MRDQTTIVTAEPRFESSSAFGAVDLTAVRLEELPFDQRYAMRSLLGHGGMGEVLLCSDQRIGREIALKVIRREDKENLRVRAAFVREACLQGQLEHPAIVPVYDLGLTTDGQAYFTMRRVRGHTLSQILSYSKVEDSDPSLRFSRSKLLAIFVDLCLAIEFAHQKGVAHRDLKPSNIMIGDFGEVYLIDWGLAALHGKLVEADDMVGGTPGYMAPEQKDRNQPVDRRSDVYALGAILFEILTLEQLNPKSGPQRSSWPSRPAIPPELEAIYRRATKTHPDERHSSARELANAVQDYLDGDRDLELRKRLAADHLSRAEDLVRHALEKRSETEESDRAAAMSELGSALALEPTSDRAAHLMVRLLLEPPATLPSEAHAQAEAQREQAKRAGARGGIVGPLAVLTMAPIVFWMGIRDPIPLIVIAVALCLTSASAALTLAGKRITDLGRNRTFALGLISIVAATRIFGPLIVVPAIATAMGLPFLLNARGRARSVMFALAAASFLVPMALEELGVIARSYAFRDGMMCVIPNAVWFPEAGSITFLCAAGLMTMSSSVALALVLHNLLGKAEERLRLHSWHLSQLAPAPARAPSRV
jgi:eukaryotic-like serine/threonine-protein kinase